MATAERCDATLILANDPDTDRLAMVERDAPSSKQWDMFTGNEIGTLLGWWLFRKYTEKHPKYDGIHIIFVHCVMYMCIYNLPITRQLFRCMVNTSVMTNHCC